MYVEQLVYGGGGVVDVPQTVEIILQTKLTSWFNLDLYSLYSAVM